MKIYRMLRPVLIYLAVIAATVFVVSYIVVGLAKNPSVLQPAFVFTSGEYMPEKATYLPGEIIVITPTLILNQAGKIQAFISYWSITTNRDARLCDGTVPNGIDLPPHNRPNDIIGQRRSIIPIRQVVPNFPPGDYYLLLTVSGPGKSETGWKARFTITEPCR
jgi:hypothetical protein